MENTAIKLHDELSALVKKMVVELGEKKTMQTLRYVMSLHRPSKDGK